MRRVAELHELFVDALLRSGAIRSPAVLRAFMSVRRHQFLDTIFLRPWDRPRVVHVDHPAPSLEALFLAYSLQPLTTGLHEGVPSTSASLPVLVAQMLEEAQLRAGLRVMEIGTGTGFTAALLAAVVAPSGRVVTLDLAPDIHAAARRALRRARVRRVRAVLRDGWSGAAEYGPFDRIIVTLGSDVVSPRWIEQLAPDGSLLVPLSHGAAHPRIRLRRDGRRLVGGFVGWSRFTPALGTLRSGQHWSDESPAMNLRAAPDALGTTDVAGLQLYLALSDDRFFLGGQEVRGAGTVLGWGLRDRRSVAMMNGYARYRTANDRLASRLERLVAQWDAEGRPGLSDYDVELIAASRRRISKRRSWIIPRGEYTERVRLRS